MPELGRAGRVTAGLVMAGVVVDGVAFGVAKSGSVRNRQALEMFLAP